MASASVLTGGLDRRLPIADVLNPAEEHHLDTTGRVYGTSCRWSAPTDYAGWYHGPSRASREISPALTNCSISSQHATGPAPRPTGLSSPAPSPRRGSGTLETWRASLSSTLPPSEDPPSTATSFSSAPPRSPPTPPIGNDAGSCPSGCSGSGDMERICNCEQCRSSRYHAHAAAHSRYRHDMDRLLGAAGIPTIGQAAAGKFASYFAHLSATEAPESSECDEDSDVSDGDDCGPPRTRPQQPPASTAAHTAAKKEAHKRKEKSRRDTQKSFFLSFAQLIPGVFGACTPHRHARNNVEEPANMTALDRAALYMTAQRLVLDQLVARGALADGELDVLLAGALPTAGTFVRTVLGRSERYVAELRRHGIQNPNFEPAAAARRARTETRGRPGPAKRRRVA